MSSVIDGLSMSDVRQSLHKIRYSWSNQTPWSPFDSSKTIGFDQMSMSQFAWLFVTGHHSARKRTDKKTQRNLIDDKLHKKKRQTAMMIAGS